MGQDLSRSATLERDLLSDDEVNLDEFDLEGFTQEEAMRYNEIAEHGQRLQDALRPKKVAASIQKVPRSIRNGHTQPSISKQMNHYIRKHPFFERSLAVITKSERRQFERNVYDFARGLGLKKSEARRHVVKAREFCGEEQSDSDSTSFEGEVDDSRWILETTSNLDESPAEAMAIDLPTRQVDSSDKTQPAPNIPSKIEKDAVSMSAGKNPTSKKRKAKAAGMDSDNDSAPPLAELAKKTAAQQAGDKIDEGELAGRTLERKRKREKRLGLSKDNRIEPEGDTELTNELVKRLAIIRDELEPKGDMEYLNDAAKPQERGKKGGRKSERNINHGSTSLKELMKLNALEQRDGFSESDDTVSMTAAVEGVSKQCKELAKALDESFNTMAALTSPSTPSKKSAYPTPDPSPSGRKDSPISSSRAYHQQLDLYEDAEEITRQPDNTELTTTPRRKQKNTATTVSPYFAKSVQKRIEKTESPYFPSPSTINLKAREKLSCIPFPPIHATSFGLVQEALAHDPFRLLVAVIFLNKTRGHVALPVFYELMESYPTPADLAAANVDDVVAIIQCLGLQNQRAATCINLAKAWLERLPERGKRYRVLHYPKKGDGKDIRTGEVIDEDDKRVGWEIGQLPGVGAYAIDSWRIFCRDELRGLPTGLPKELTPETKEADIEKEWARVLPLDKELRAYLRWRWLRNGWEWDPVTGERKRADGDALVKADKGGVMYEGDSSNSVIGQWEVNALGSVKVELEPEKAPGKKSIVGKPKVLETFQSL